MLLFQLPSTMSWFQPSLLLHLTPSASSVARFLKPYSPPPLSFGPSLNFEQRFETKTARWRSRGGERLRGLEVLAFRPGAASSASSDGPVVMNDPAWPSERNKWLFIFPTACRASFPPGPALRPSASRPGALRGDSALLFAPPRSHCCCGRNGEGRGARRS